MSLRLWLYAPLWSRQRWLSLCSFPSTPCPSRTRTRDRFTLPLSLQQARCRFLLSIQKEKKRRGGFAAERAVPIPRLWFSLLCFWRCGEEKEPRGAWAYRIVIFTLCVLGSMLIDGLHIPIVTSLRRLSTVVVVWERLCLYTDGPCQPWETGVTAQRTDTSPRDYYYYLAGQARHSGIATVLARILGSGLEDQNRGVVVERGPDVLFDLCPRFNEHSPGQENWGGVGGGGHRGAEFIRCSVKMYKHVLSGWPCLSDPTEGTAQGSII